MHLCRKCNFVFAGKIIRKICPKCRGALTWQKKRRDVTEDEQTFMNSLLVYYRNVRYINLNDITAEQILKVNNYFEQ